MSEYELDEVLFDRCLEFSRAVDYRLENFALDAVEKRLNEHGWVKEHTCTVIEENVQGLNMLVESCSNCGNYMPRHAWTGKLLPYCPHCGAKVVSK